MSDDTRGRGLFQRLKGVLGDRDRRTAPDRRASKRLALPIPVRLRVAEGEAATHKLRDISQQGFCVEEVRDGLPGARVVARFDGYPEVCAAFQLAGEIVRVTDEEPPAAVVRIDRRETPAAALRQYRALVLHYIRHKPLLDDVARGYFEGRCEACGWIGRVGAKKPTCPKCGRGVAPPA